MPLDSVFKKRIVLITGKGGVGRSLVTAALAHTAKRRGVRSLVCEIGDDPEDYSPLARYFGRDRLPKACEDLEPDIRGVVLLARTGQELFLRTALHSSTLARAALGSDALRRLLSAGPSFREMGVFFQLLSYLRQERSKGEPEHPLILVDMPATGHTLSLTGLPDLLLKLMPRGPIATALRDGQSYLNDPERAAAWVVTLPETLPVSEALELLDGLTRTSMPVGGVIMNRIPIDPFTSPERAALRPYLEAHDVLGGEGFRRPDLATREMARLRAGTRVPIYALPELPHEGLVMGIADEIERTRRVRPSMRP
jgi:arsenite/tail-anchored protein-transporting ATPase